jgi:hypothetical protein
VGRPEQPIVGVEEFTTMHSQGNENSMSAKKPQTPNIVVAEKKLRQAEFFLSWLEHAPKEIALRYGRTNQVNHDELEYYFSACLSAARSVFYTLSDTKAKKVFFEVEARWRKNLPSDAVRAIYNQIKTLRDDDVHYGDAGATPHPKSIADPFGEFQFFGGDIFPSAALHGRDPLAEETNPDGRTVSGRGFRGTVGLYIDRDGGLVEASTACREFIDLLRSLLDATKAAFP